MASFEEEALRRAKQLHSNTSQAERDKRQKPMPVPNKEEPNKQISQETKNPPQPQHKNLVDLLLADKEQSLILLLLLLLSGAKADPSLLLALMYLLM